MLEMFFNKFNIQVNGRLTVTENVADTSGVTQALMVIIFDSKYLEIQIVFLRYIYELETFLRHTKNL